MHHKRYFISGFTIIEMVVSIAIIGIIGLILTDLLGRSFRSSDKTQSISIIKQNGETAINTISQVLRNSQRSICIGDYQNDQDQPTLVVKKAGQYIRFRVLNKTSSQNSRLEQETLQVNDQSQLVNLCSQDLPPDVIRLSRVTLTNTDPVSGVSIITSGSDKTSFALNSQGGYPDVITIKLKIGLGFSSPQSDQIVFQTTVKLQQP